MAFTFLFSVTLAAFFLAFTFSLFSINVLLSQSVGNVCDGEAFGSFDNRFTLECFHPGPCTISRFGVNAEKIMPHAANLQLKFSYLPAHCKETWSIIRITCSPLINS